MPIEIDVEQSAIEQARQLAEIMRKFGDKDLIPALRRELTASTKEARVRVRNRIREELPHRGGLNKWVGKAPTASSKILPHKASVTIRLGQKKHDLYQLNERGIARHPLFNLRKHWFTTYLPVGDHWWEASFDPEIPEIRQHVDDGIAAAIEAAMDMYGGGE